MIELLIRPGNCQLIARTTINLVKEYLEVDGESSLLTEALANTFKIIGQLEIQLPATGYQGESAPLAVLESFAILTVVRTNQLITDLKKPSDAVSLERHLGALTNFCRLNTSHKEALVESGIMPEINRVAKLLFRSGR